MNIPIENFTVISNIAKMREVITGGKFDIENSDLTSKTYDQLHELQNILIPNYNEAINNLKTQNHE